MKLLSVLCVLMCVGCASKFDGEWVEVRAQEHQTIATNEPRMAINFCPPSMVRVGLVVEKMDVVDGNSVQEAAYFLFDGWTKAQFGTMVARVEGDEMVTINAGGTERRFKRVKGKSVFPPRVQMNPVG